MKVLEVTTMARIRDPHRPPGTALSQNDTFKASDGYALELHESGLACFIRGRNHTRLAPIACAVVDEGVEPEPKSLEISDELECVRIDEPWRPAVEPEGHAPKRRGRPPKRKEPGR